MNTTFLTKTSLLLFLCVWVLVGCDTVDSGSNEEAAPTVLPAEAFALDLDMFGTQASKSNQENSHYVAAVWRVGVATVITGTILYYPAVLTEAIQEVEPIVNEDTYIWSSITQVNGRDHGVELRARLDGEFIDWIMRVSGLDDETGQYLEKFVLYEASTGILSNSGTFEVFYPKDGGSLKVMDGSYIVEDENNHTLEFSIPVQVEDIGGSVGIYNHAETINSVDLTGPLGGNHFIEWNNQTNAGSLTADDYNEGERACWDSELQNVECEGV